VIGARAGGYELEAQIGQGAHGSVWRARNVLTGQLAAVKVLRCDRANRTDDVERLVREGVAAARVRHPNVVAVHDVARLDNGEVYVAMEYLEGRTLAQQLAERGALRPAAALELLVPIAAGLEAMHAAGVLHRDLKPENVFVTTAGRVVVLDLGLARLDALDDEPLTQVGAGAGTPGYTAPEQAAELGDVDERADIYSLAMIAVRTLTGTTPYLKAGGPNSMLAVLDRARARPAEVRELLATAAAPASWIAALERATSYDRAARPKSAAALLSELAVARRRAPRWRTAALAVAFAAASVAVVASAQRQADIAPPVAAAMPTMDAAASGGAPDARSTAPVEAPIEASPPRASRSARHRRDAGVVDPLRPLGPL
jgi:serine/threonine protein kinase